MDWCFGGLDCRRENYFWNVKTNIDIHFLLPCGVQLLIETVRYTGSILLHLFDDLLDLSDTSV